MRGLSLGLAVLCLVPGLAWADGEHNPVTVTPLSTQTTTASGQVIDLPDGNVAVVVSRYRIEPGAKLPVHRHPNQRYAYVQAGTLAVILPDTGQRFEYKAGDFIIEVLEQWHYGENTGTEPVELLVIDQVPPGTTTNTIVRP